MKVALFIGHHKTGSTSLQTYLARHYLPLLKEGILYPAVEAEGAASNLAWALRGEEPVNVYRMNVREPHNALAFRMLNEVNDSPVPDWHPNLPTGFQMLQLIEAQMKAIDPQHVVICSEVMSRFAEKGWHKVLPRMQHRFGQYDSSVVLNLRRPDEYLASWHLQRLKFGSAIKPLRHGAHESYYNGVHFRYDLIVSRWMEALPGARMVVRNYEDVVAAGGSVIDFFAQSQIDYLPDDSDSRMNSSVPYAMVEIVRQANIKLPENRRAVLNYIFDAMTRVPYARNSEVELFGPIHRAAFMKAFRPVHAALSAQLGIARFFPDIEEGEVCRPIPEMEAATAALEYLRKDAREHAPSDIVGEFIANLSFDD